MVDRQRVAAVIRKDWMEVVRNKQLVAPLVVLPLLFAVILPVAVIIVGDSGLLAAGVTGMQSFLDKLPAGIVPEGYTVEQTVVYAVLVYFMAPFFLMIPLMVASITAASSFVGEKERHTIEGLLYTPLTNRELVLAKVLGSLIPAVVLTWAAFGVYTLIVLVLGSPAVGEVFFPTWTWIVLVVALVPAVAFLATSLIVAVSGSSTTVQGSQSVAVLVVFPVIGLVISQATGIMLFDVPVALIVTAIVLVLDVIAFFAVVARFDRERIVTKL